MSQKRNYLVPMLMVSQLFDLKSMLDVSSSLLTSISPDYVFFYIRNSLFFCSYSVSWIYLYLCVCVSRNSGFVYFVPFYSTGEFLLFKHACARVVLVIYNSLLHSIVFRSLLLFSYVSLWLIEYIYSMFYVNALAPFSLYMVSWRFSCGLKYISIYL